MNQKRFKGCAEKTGQHYMLIINDELGEEYCLTDDFFKSKDIIFEIVDLLNVMNDTLLKQAKENHKLSNKNIEQQTTINKLNGELELTANTKLYSRRELERKVDEQQATISRLEEENEQLKNRLNKDL